MGMTSSKSQCKDGWRMKDEGQEVTGGSFYSLFEPTIFICKGKGVLWISKSRWKRRNDEMDEQNGWTWN